MGGTGFGTSARAAFEQGLALEAAGQLAQAFVQFQQATRLDPANGAAWRHLGNLLRRMGELGPASVCFERAVEQGDDRPLNEFFLSAVGVGDVVARPPAAFVRALFDQYAERFDTHLLGDLHYRAPQMLAALIDRHGRAGYGSVLDLGCGTGLAGAPFRGRAGHITGVDLSREMLARAVRERRYDAAIEADMTAALARAEAASFDLVLCCDAMIYVGDLVALFAGVARVARAGAGFGFTIESCEAEIGFDLLPSLRYAHSERYVRALAATHGFDWCASESGTLRVEDGQPVDGLVVHLLRR